MESSYELFDHTADIGIRVRGNRLADLVVPAGEGLYAVIGDIVTGERREEMSIDLTGDTPETLLRDYLAELLILFEQDHRIVSDVRVSRFDRDGLAVRAATEGVDLARSTLEREVKAITYHALEIREVAGGFEGTVIVDI